jgi:hypothetical protein
MLLWEQMLPTLLPELKKQAVYRDLAQLYWNDMVSMYFFVEQYHFPSHLKTHSAIHQSASNSA